MLLFDACTSKLIQPLSFLTGSATFPVNAVLISQETNVEVTSLVRD